MNKSCIYEGHVIHHRHQPVDHRFEYSLCMMYVDLDELDSLFTKNRFWSASFPNLAWFRRADHHGDPAESLDQSIRNLVESKLGVKPSGPIRLLTHFRYFGYVINPISVYYCFDKMDQLQFVVAEVTNTPWGERHCYVIDARDRNQREFWVKKSMHVSPFMQMEFNHVFRLSEPGESIHVAIENKKQVDDKPFFGASLNMKRVPITARNLNRVLFRYPLMTFQVLARIYWQALCLWWKKVPVFKHPRTIEREKTNTMRTPMTESIDSESGALETNLPETFIPDVRPTRSLKRSQLKDKVLQNN